MDAPEIADRAVEQVRDAFGPDLRAVVVHQFTPEQAWDVRYVREDVREDYDTADLEAVLEDVTEDFVFEALVQDWHEQIRRLGVLHGSILTFDDALVVRVVLTDQYGLCFSLEPERQGDVFDVIEDINAGDRGDD